MNLRQGCQSARVTARSISLRFLDTMLLGGFLSQPGHLLKRKLGTFAPMSQQPHSQKSGWLLCSLGGVGVHAFAQEGCGLQVWVSVHL